MEHSSVDALMVWLVNTLMNSAWQVPLVLVVAMVTARLVARLYSAAAVHWTWVSALVLATVLPAIRLNVWPSFPWGRATAVSGGHVQVTMMPGTAAAGGHLRLSFAMMSILMAVYGAVIFYFAGRIVWGVWKTRLLHQSAAAVQLSEELQQRWNVLCRRLDVTRVVLSESADVVGPAMVGMRTVLLPMGFLGKVEESDLEAALAHELAHVRRRDYAKNVGYALLMLPVSYHPGAWLIKKALGESREAVCDAMAAEVLESRRMYARSLLRLATVIPSGLRGGATAAVGIFEGNTLERRVSLMMERGKRLQGAARVAAIVAVMVLSGTAIVSMVGTHLMVQAANTTAEKPKSLQVPTSVMSQRMVKQVDPIYPKHARATHNTVNGSCIVGLEINSQGVPENVHVVKSLRKDYDESALTAVRQWRWKPYTLNERPIPIETKVQITFAIY
jgi:TonB family protein